MINLNNFIFVMMHLKILNIPTSYLLKVMKNQVQHFTWKSNIYSIDHFDTAIISKVRYFYFLALKQLECK